MYKKLMVNLDLNVLLDPEYKDYSKIDLEKEIASYKNQFNKELQLKDIILHNIYVECSLWSYICYIYDKHNENNTEKFLFIESLCKKYDLITELNYRGKFYFSEEPSLNLSLQFLIVIENKLLLNNQSKFNEDESYLLGYFFLKNFYLPDMKDDNKNQAHIKMMLSFVQDNKEKLKSKLILNEEDFCKLFFENQYLPIIPNYINKEIWNSLGLELKTSIDLMYRKNNNKFYYKQFPDWFNQMINFYDPVVIVKKAFTAKKFSPFKFFGYKLEEATGYPFPKKYNKNITRKHPNKIGSTTHLKSLEQQFEYVQNDLKNIQISEDELKNWYIYMIIGNMKNLFQITSKVFPLSNNCLECPELSFYLERSIDGFNWRELHNKIAFKEKLEENIIDKKSFTPRTKI